MTDNVRERQAEAWDEAIQLADDEGCLLYHQAKVLKAANPYRNEP